MATPFKAQIEELSRALQALHRDLLMHEARRLEHKSERKMNPYELLNASLNDPEMAWLRELSSLIVFIDTTVDEATNLNGQEANAVADRALALLEKAGDAPATPFWEKYTRYLADHPDLIIQHAKVKDLASALKPRM